jgi:tRNA (guanine26-N2/guanine27-N2)-dimethyltransferase
MEELSKQKMLSHKPKIQKLLAHACDEADAPMTYYVLDKISRKLALPVPSVRAFLNDLRGEGFQASLTHFNSRGIRTNASAKCMRELFPKALKRL